jgi:DNA excision repair protein ERCC-6
MNNKRKHFDLFSNSVSNKVSVDELPSKKRRRQSRKAASVDEENGDSENVVVLDDDSLEMDVEQAEDVAESVEPTEHSYEDDGDDVLWLDRKKRVEEEDERQRLRLESVVDESAVTENNDEDVEIAVGFRLPASMYDSLYEYQQTGVKWLWQLHTQFVGG